MLMCVNYDMIIVGSGIAGLSAAVEAAKKCTVLLITKSKLNDSSTELAQGGIASAMDIHDTPKFHKEDTLQAGAGLCDEAAVDILVEEGPCRVESLIAMGAQFDRKGDTYCFTKEGAHSRRRILHAADKTGAEIERTLAAQVRKTAGITICEDLFLLDLWVDAEGCRGVLCLDGDGLVSNIFAKTVLLATGGCCQIFLYNTNPPLATGDGLAAAYRAGAEVTDMEFVQFHPTTLYSGDKKPVSLFLISEAVRGEGAILRNHEGIAFMEAYHPLKELAPRDIVARAIVAEMKRTKTSCVFLDLSSVVGNLAQRFPTIYARCLESKIDIIRDFIPVAPAAHYMMGGIKTDLYGQTSIPRLFAIGELSATGVHGANRLASNSLLDGLVFGFRAAEKALSFPEFEREFVLPEIHLAERVTVSKTELLVIKDHIKTIMWQQVGIIRDTKGLHFAQKIIARMSAEINQGLCEDAVLLAEVQNMVLVASLVCAAALSRTESRGAHFRRDYLQTNDAQWLRHIVMKND